MWYNTGYENPHFYPSIKRRRTAPNSGGTAFVGCLRLAPLPNLTGIVAKATSPRDCPPAGLRRPDGAQRDPWLQYFGAGCLAARLLTPPSAAHQLHGRESRAAQRSLASQPTRLWLPAQHLDLAVSGSRQLPDRHPRSRGL